MHNNEIKILLLSQSSSIYGGVERWLTDICIGLKENGFSPILALAKGSFHHKPSKFMSAYPELKKIDTLEIDASCGIAAEKIYLIEKNIKKINPDIIMPVLLNDGMIAAINRRKSGQAFRILYPVHENDIWAFNTIKHFQSSIDMLVTVNKLFKNVVHTRLSWPKNRVRHIRCGALQPKNTSDKIFSDQIYIGYCGKVRDKEKRAGDLIVLIHELDKLNIDYKLIIAGEGPLINNIKDMFNDKIYNHSIELLGVVDRNQLYDYFYKKIDVLFIPSYSETGPIVAWEAMLHGVVLVSSIYRGALAEGIFQHGQTALLFPVGEISKSAKLIKELFINRNLYKTISNKSKEYANQYLTIQYMTESWINLLSDMQKLPIQNDEQANVSKMIDDNETWGLPVPLASWLRKRLKRPVRHGGSREEWPLYIPEKYSKDEINSFDKKLWELERIKCK